MKRQTKLNESMTTRHGMEDPRSGHRGAPARRACGLLVGAAFFAGALLPTKAAQAFEDGVGVVVAIAASDDAQAAAQRALEQMPDASETYTGGPAVEAATLVGLTCDELAGSNWLIGFLDWFAETFAPDVTSGYPLGEESTGGGGSSNDNEGTVEVEVTDAEFVPDEEEEQTGAEEEEDPDDPTDGDDGEDEDGPDGIWGKELLIPESMMGEYLQLRAQWNRLYAVTAITLATPGATFSDAYVEQFLRYCRHMDRFEARLAGAPLAGPLFAAPKAPVRGGSVGVGRPVWR